MDTAVVSATSFETAKWSLRRRRKPTFDQVVWRLQQVGFLARTAVILQELDPAKFAELRDGFHWTGEYGENESVIQATLEEISAVAPLDLEFLETALMEEFGIPYLQPEPCGFPMGWDEWGEMAADPRDCSDSMGLFIFVSAMRLGESDALSNASERFSWDFPEVDLEKYGNTDFEKLYKLLDKEKLSCFKAAIDVCLYSTGNPYFDFNPYDEEVIADLPAYSMDGVRELQEYWQAAQPILVDYRIAEKRFEEDSGLAWKLFKLWVRSSEKRQRARIGGPNRSLAEIWGEEEPERVIDPFYGPLDGRDEEES